MLTKLYIDNVAVIEHAQLPFTAGLTVLTGETGAGKSIIIDALSAVLGERTSRELVRAGSDSATVTAVFEALPQTVIDTLAEQGYAPEEDGTLLLRRRISAENKSSCYIGGQPCTAAVLRGIGRRLVNIHGQHENQALLAVEQHIRYLDRLGELEDIRARYEQAYHRYCATRRQLKKTEMDEAEKAQRLDMLRFQTQEIDGAALTAGEEEALTARRDILRNAEKIGRLLRLTDRCLNGEEDGGALSAVEEAVGTLREAARYLPQAETIATQMESALYDLQDGAADVQRLADSPDFDSQELDAVEERLALIRRLCGKYGADTAAVLRFAEQAHEELRRIELSDEEHERLSVQLAAEQESLLETAAALTAARKRAALIFEQQVAQQLAFLNMPRVRLAVSIEPTALTVTGADKVEFLLAANPGEPPRPIAKVTSGGELSRIMLALKAVMASADDIPTLIFDEIDAGISGRAASKVGQKLREIAALGGKQVLCVTHLAQIAVCAHSHLLIEKEVSGERTYTRVQALDETARLSEIARIIGGEVTLSARQTAQEMLSAAQASSIVPPSD